jgi:hypothetical protein
MDLLVAKLGLPLEAQADITGVLILVGALLYGTVFLLSSTYNSGTNGA